MPAYGEQLGEQQARGPRSDDADLGAHGPSQPPARSRREDRASAQWNWRRLPGDAERGDLERRHEPDDRSRRMLGTTTPTAAATVPVDVADRHGHGARAQGHLLHGAGVATTADLAELP